MMKRKKTCIDLPKLAQTMVFRKLLYRSLNRWRGFAALFLVFTFSLGAHPTWGSVLGDLATKLSPGTFAELTGMNNWNNGNIMVPCGTGIANSITQYANKAVWNPLAKRFQFVGSAHAGVGCAGTNVRGVYYDEASNTWGILPTPLSSTNQPQHSYDQNTINSLTGEHFYKHYDSTEFQKLDSGASSWTNLAANPMSNAQCCTSLAWFPDYQGGRVIWVDGDWGVWSWAPGNPGSWAQLAQGNGNDGSGKQRLTMDAYNVFAHYSPLCQCVVLGAGSGFYKLNSDGTFTTLNLSGGPSLPRVGPDGTSIVTEPITGKLIFISQTSMYEFNPQGTGSWSVISTAYPSFFTTAGSVSESLISAPISNYGVIMYVKCDDASACRAYLYKHASGTGTPAPPTAPTVSISANPASVLLGLVSTLSWSSTNATSCNASGGWSGPKAVSGSQITVNLFAATTFTLTCTGLGGSASQSATVAITGSTPPPAPPPSGTSTLLVKFGKTSSLNTFGLSGWSTVIKDIYTDYQDIGPGGTTIVVGDNYAYNYQGVTGTPKTLSSGDKIRVTWYNNSSAAVGFIPNISFTSGDRIIAGTGTWYPMTSVTVPPFGSATSEYAFTSASAGSYSLVNVNVNYTNSQVIVADKIELFPVGSSTSPSFDFALSNGGSKSVAQGQSVSNSIGVSVISGTAQAVTFSASGLPAGATASFSPTSCSPSCSPTLSINTTGSTPGGSSTVTVTAIGGGVTRTTAFTLTVSAPTTPPPTGGSPDFQTRCTASGVVRCFGFDTVADLGGTYGNNFGNFNNAGACNTTTIRCPVIDTTLTASGAGSLKFTQPSQSGAGAAGQWFTNFSPDLVTQFGAGGEFWIQWRQRFDTAFTTNVYTGGDGEGPKQINISGGDSPGCTVANNTNCRSSNVDIELVMQNLSQRKYAQMYGYLERSGEPQQFTQLAESFGSDIKFQNARPSPYCLYSQGVNGTTAGTCIGYFPNEWMTFKVHVKLGPLSGPYWTNTQIDMWIGREGQALQPAISWTGNYGASSNKFGKIWLVPYITNKDASQAHPQANTWYDELIISTQNIADPGTGTGGGGQAPAPPSGLVLK